MHGGKTIGLVLFAQYVSKVQELAGRHGLAVKLHNCSTSSAKRQLPLVASRSKSMMT